MPDDGAADDGSGAAADDAGSMMRVRAAGQRVPNNQEGGVREAKLPNQQAEETGNCQYQCGMKRPSLGEGLK